MVRHYSDHFIDGAWVSPAGSGRIDVVNPATEAVFATVPAGTAADVDRAVSSARAAFPAYAATSREERIALLRRILDAYNARTEDLVQAVSAEMGAPLAFARDAQVWSGRVHLEATAEALADFAFTEARGTTLVVKEPIGVAGLITPWNWPLNQIVCKVAPALAAGCTVVLKPSEVAPISAIVFAEIMAAAGVPKGVFNLVNGTGPEVGHAMSAHPGIDMMSFTGSTRAGIQVAKAAADTVKRVAQELGGKSANLILADKGFAAAVRKGVEACFSNSGQSCDAPTRMLVPAARHEEALAVAREAAAGQVVGPPDRDGTVLGPVVSAIQFDKIQRLIEAGVAEGATLVAGGPGRPEGLDKGFYVKPTVFGHVTGDMTVAKEEIFGPVLTISSYADEDEAIRIAHDTVFGLASYIAADDLDQARRVAGRLRTGTVNINYPDWDIHAPFGGYGQSGNGREYGDYGIEDYCETKSVVGYGR